MLAGVEVPASVGGAYLGDERFAPFWAAAEETGAVVFIHPTTRGFDVPVFGDFYLWNTVGNPFETTITAAHMVMAGRARAPPGAARDPGARRRRPAGAARAAAARWSFQPQARARLREDPEASIARLYFDTVTHDPAVLRALVDVRGRRPRAARHRPPVRHGRPAPGGDGAGGRPGRRRARRARRHRAAAARARGAHVTADIVVAGAGHNSLITAAYLAASGREVLVLDSRAIPGGGAATEELLGPGYLIDSCSTGHTLIQTNPLLTAGRAGAEGALRARVPGPRPVRARRVPRRRAAHRVDGPRAHGRGDRALLEGRRRGLPAAARRLRRGQAHLRGRHVQPGRLRAVGRAAAARAPEGQRVAAAAGAERVGRHPARVREPARAGLPALAGLPDAGADRLARLRAARVLDRVRPPAAELDDPARRLRAAHRRARATVIVDHGGTVLCGKRVVAARGRGRPLRRRRDRGRRDVPARARRWSRRSTSST